MCLAGNFGACDGEAVVVILDVLRQDMVLGITPEAACYYSIDDADDALQDINQNLQTCIHELEAKNTELTQKLQVSEKSKKWFFQTMKELSKTNDTLKANSQSQSRMIDNLNKKIAKLWGTIDQLRQEVAVVKKENQQLEEKNQELEEKNQELEEENQQLKEEAQENLLRFGFDRQFAFSRQHEAIQSDVIDWNTAFAEHASH